MNLRDEAESLLLHQFEGSAKLKALLNALIKPLDEVLEQLQYLHNGCYIDEATGERLDIIGRIVGQARNGLNDEEYKPWLKVRIRLNIGYGRAQDVLEILKILDCTVLLQEYLPNLVEISFLKEPKVHLKSLFSIVKAACPVAINCQFKRSFKEPLFSFDVSMGHFAEFYEEDLV